MRRKTFSVPVPTVPNPHLLTKAREAMREMETTRHIRKNQKRAENYDKRLAEAVELVDRHNKIWDQVEDEKRKLRVSRSKDCGTRIVNAVVEEATS